VTRQAIVVDSGNLDNAPHSAAVWKAISSTGDITAHDLIPLLAGNIQTTLVSEVSALDMQHIGRNASITWSLLYYFGVITCAEDGKMKIPNASMRRSVCDSLPAAHHLLILQSRLYIVFGSS
jgi:hypothetical protein